jgi:hypothetical protein
MTLILYLLAVPVNNTEYSVVILLTTMCVYHLIF